MTLTDGSGNGPTLPLYLGPVLPRWQPRSVADVEAAIDDGTLRERHWLDVKASLGDTDGAKKGIARDLASFANDGGALLIGVTEDKPTQTLEVTPVALDGLAESVDQIARSRCDPPLYVVCHPLRSPQPNGDHAEGVLLVEVPPSPLAPHMTDGRYYGRGDTTNHRLTDGEVARLHARRVSREVTAQQLIEVEMARDPVPAEHRDSSHLYVVARPLASPPDLLTHLIGTHVLTQLVGAAGQTPGANYASPGWNYLNHQNEPRAYGIGFHSYGLLGRRFLPELEDASEEGLLDLEVQDDGTLILFCGRAAARRHDHHFVIERAIIALTRCLITLAGGVGATSGYAGRWLLALGVSDLVGRYSSSSVDRMVLGRGSAPYSAATYVQGTEASTVELLQRPGAVTTRLAQRLLRGLGEPLEQYRMLLADVEEDS